MNPHSRYSGRTLRRVVLLGLVAGVIVALLGSCSEDGPDEDCWVGLDTLYVSGIAVTDTIGVRAVFEAYVDSVEAAGGDFRGGGTAWEYVASRFSKEWKERRYWELTHSAVFIESGRSLRRYLHVDENGVLVVPMGCI